MSSPFDRKDQWIQQGPDGHHFYVRKKNPPHLPSFKAIFREAFHDLCHGHPSYWREWKRQNKEKRRQVKEAKAAEAAAASLTQAANLRSATNQPSNLSVNGLPPNPPFNHPLVTPSIINLSQQSQSGPIPLNMSNIQTSQSDNGNGNNQPGAPRGILKPELQRFPSTNNGFPPWQGMPLQPQVQPPTMSPGLHQPYVGYPPQVGYGPPPVGYGIPGPFQPPVNQNFAQSQAHMLQAQPHLQMPPGPTQPAGGWPPQPLPPGARAMSPPRYPTADDLKYKCAVCDRFRSAGYHYRHPLGQGQLPPKTICRKCRNTSTDSEDDTRDSQGRYTERFRGRRSRSRSVGRIESVGPYPGRTPSQRGRTLSRSYSHTDDDWYESENRRTRSASRSTSIDSIPRALSRARSRSVVSRIRVKQPVEEEIVIVKRPLHVRHVVYVDDDDAPYNSTDQPKPEYRTHHRHCRAPTPAPHPMRRQCSDPGLRSPYDSGQTQYFEDVKPPPSRYPQQSWSRGTTQDYGSEVEKDWYANTGGRGSSGSRERHSSYRDYDRGVDRRARPASRNTSHPDAGAAFPAPHDGPGRPSSFRRMERTNSRSRGVPRPVPDPRPANVNSPSPSDDYDYYDKDGMRVRVREI